MPPGSSIMWYTGCNFTSRAPDINAPAAGTRPGSLGCDDDPTLLRVTPVVTQRAAKANADRANKPAVGPFFTLPLSFRSGLHSAHPA